MALADCLISYISAAHLAYSQIAYLQHHHIAYNLARSLTSIMRPTNLQSHKCEYCLLLNSDPADMSLHMRSEMASRILYNVEQRFGRHVAACAVGNSFPAPKTNYLHPWVSPSLLRADFFGRRYSISIDQILPFWANSERDLETSEMLGKKG